MSTRPSLIINLPKEVHLNILTYLRAFDLSSLQQTCRFYNDREMITLTVQTFAKVVYPKELTDGYETAPPLFGIAKGRKKQGLGKVSDHHSSPSSHLGYENLRDMEMLILVRILNAPEPPLLESNNADDDDTVHPPNFYYYVSKNWCKVALRWIESQEELRRAAYSTTSSTKQPRRQSRKQRARDRRLSDAMPPWPNANQDLLCPHGDLKRCSGNRAARARRRVIDRHAWRVLRKLYPDSVPLRCKRYLCDLDECLQCRIDEEIDKKNVQMERQRQETDRKKPLDNPLIRAFYLRASRGFPQGYATKSEYQQNSTVAGENLTAVLSPGTYHAIPRQWCQRWRKYIKTGADKQLSCLPPDAVEMMCDRHVMPLIPDHLRRFVEGESVSLFPPNDVLESTSYVSGELESTSFDFSSVMALQVAATADGATIANLDVAHELDLQRAALENIRLDALVGTTPSKSSASFVRSQSLVEVVTEDEFSALEEAFWPEIQGTCFTIKFEVTLDDLGFQSVEWHTKPGRECSGEEIVCSKRCFWLRNRSRVSLNGFMNNEHSW